jgi:hypothetical protein
MILIAHFIGIATGSSSAYTPGLIELAPRFFFVPNDSYVEPVLQPHQGLHNMTRPVGTGS